MDQRRIPFDWGSLLLGSAPALYCLEITFRTLLIYGWTLAAMRWLGGRPIAQLSLADFLIVVALGSAVGDAAFYAEVPPGQAMLVSLLVVAVTKALERVVVWSPRAAPIIDGDPALVLSGGRIVFDNLQAREMPVPTLVEQLRIRDVANPGAIEAARIESSSKLSLLRRRLPKAGPHHAAARTLAFTGAIVGAGPVS